MHLKLLIEKISTFLIFLVLLVQKSQSHPSQSHPPQSQSPHPLHPSQQSPSQQPSQLMRQHGTSSMQQKQHSSGASALKIYGIFKQNMNYSNEIYFII